MVRKVFGYLSFVMIFVCFFALPGFLFFNQSQSMSPFLIIGGFILTFVLMVVFSLLSAFLLKGSASFTAMGKQHNWGHGKPSDSNPDNKYGTPFIHVENSHSGSSFVNDSSFSSGNEAEDPKLMKRCPQCGTMNDIDARFCKHCGKDISDKK
jgi:hypothetical protein